MFRHSNLAAVRGEVLNPGHLHALSPDLMRMRGGKPERKFSSDQDSVKPQAGHARGDRCYWEVSSVARTKVAYDSGTGAVA